MFIYLIADHDFSFIHHLQLHSSQTRNSWIVKYQELRAIMILILPSNCLRHLLTHSFSVVGVALRLMQMKAALRVECVQYYWWMKRSVKSLNITLLVCSINADSICNGESFTFMMCVFVYLPPIAKTKGISSTSDCYPLRCVEIAWRNVYARDHIRQHPA